MVENNFRTILQEELVKRCQQNPRYSLRAYARNLNIEPSFLSKLLNQKRSITKDMTLKLGTRLGLEPDRLNKLQRSEDDSTNRYNPLTLDAFRIIADWYHYAILELLLIDSYKKATYRKFATTLGISTAETQTAFERLIRMDFISKNSNGEWENNSGNNTTLGNPFTHVAFRKLQKSILEKALIALEDIPFEKRDQSSITMAIDTDLIPEAKKRLKQFRRSFCNWIQKAPHKRDVYQLSLSFYPTTLLYRRKK